MFIWDFAATPIMDALIDWSYGQMIGFLGNFFAEMGGMGIGYPIQKKFNIGLQVKF